MTSKEEITSILRDSYSYLASEYSVKRIGFFGFYARGEVTKASDVDLLVEFERPIGFRFVEFVEYMERLLGKNVDVLTPAGIQGIRIKQIARSIEESTVYV